MDECPTVASQRTSRAHALASLHLAVLLFGFAGLFGKWITLPPSTIVFGRTSIALLALCNSTLAGQRSATEIAFWQNTCAAVCLLPALALGLALPSGTELLGLVVLGLLCTAVAHTCFIGSLRTVSAHTASIVAALEPVYGIALAALLLGELPDARTLGGAA